MRILFVCTGNTCRSPMAEALLRYRMPEVEVRSAGIFAGYKESANQKAIEVLAEQQVTLDHESQPVTEKLLSWSDLVLTMTTGHKQALIQEFPDFQHKYYTLKEYVVEQDKAQADIEGKNSIFTQKDPSKNKDEQYNGLLNQPLKEEAENVQNLADYDIIDPFGGDMQVYRETLQELEEYIEQLVKKIKP